MNEEHVYHEYASWKLDKHDFLQSLIHQESSLMLRFKHVFHVVEHLYTKMVDSLSYTEDELNIFQTGFYYLADQFYQTHLRYILVTLVYLLDVQ